MEGFRASEKREREEKLRPAQTNEEANVWSIDETLISITDTCVGRGSLSSVFVGEYNASPVAVKVMYRSDGVSEQLFGNEISLLMTLRHPKIVHVVGGSLTPFKLLIVQELLEGDLFNRLHLKTPQMPLKEAVVVLTDALEGLQWLHVNKVVHRDIKPHNIFLTKEGGGKLGNQNFHFLAFSES
jgi:serine/threonine protein kinase